MPNFTITASAGTGGTITPSGAVVVASGANQTFAIAANTGYHISLCSPVLVDGVSVGSVATYTFTNVLAAHTIASYFALPTLPEIRAALKVGLHTISGLQVESYIPDTYTLPLAVLSLNQNKPVDYDYTAQNVAYVYHFQIEVLVNKGASVYQAQIDLDHFIDPLDTKSVKNAIEAVNLWGSAKRLIGSPAYGAARFGSTDYLGIRFSLDVTV